MACFLISTAEAIVVTALKKHTEKKEEKEALTVHGMSDATIPAAEHTEITTVHKIPFSHKLKWLQELLFGGSALLLFEHIWHGEVVPWFPFLSAMSNANDAAEMFHEMATVGVGMAALVTAAWGAMCFIADAMTRKAAKTEDAAESVSTDNEA